MTGRPPGSPASSTASVLPSGVGTNHSMPAPPQLVHQARLPHRRVAIPWIVLPRFAAGPSGSGTADGTATTGHMAQAPTRSRWWPSLGLYRDGLCDERRILAFECLDRAVAPAVGQG